MTRSTKPSEMDAVVKLVLPWLKAKGYTEDLMEFNHGLRIAYGRRLHTIYPDIVIRLEGSPMVVVEAKRPDSSLEDDIKQAVSYALVLETPALYAVVTDGKTHIVVDAIGKQRLDDLPSKDVILDHMKGMFVLASKFQDLRRDARKAILRTSPGAQDPRALFLTSLGEEGSIGQVRNTFWRMEDLYIPPTGYRAIWENLKRANAVVLVGKPFTGKTFTAVHILYQLYKQGYDVAWIRHPADYHPEQVLANLRRRIAYLIEDPFGRTETDLRSLPLSSLRSLLALARKGRSKFIITSRSTVLASSVEGRTHGLDGISVRFETDSSGNATYDDSAREEMLRKYARVFGVRWRKNRRLNSYVFGSILPRLTTPFEIRLFSGHSLKDSSVKDLEESCQKAQTYHEELGSEMSRGLPLHARLLCFLANVLPRLETAPSVFNDMWFHIAERRHLSSNLLDPFESAKTLLLGNYIRIEGQDGGRFEYLDTAIDDSIMLVATHPENRMLLEDGVDFLVKSRQEEANFCGTLALVRFFDAVGSVLAEEFDDMYDRSEAGFQRTVLLTLSRTSQMPKRALARLSTAFARTRHEAAQALMSLIVQHEKGLEVSSLANLVTRAVSSAQAEPNAKFLRIAIRVLSNSPDAFRKLLRRVEEASPTERVVALEAAREVWRDAPEASYSVVQRIVGDKSPYVLRAFQEMLEIEKSRNSPFWHSCRGLVAEEPRRPTGPLTVDELTRAIKQSIDRAGMREEEARAMAAHVLNFFGYSDSMIDNVLEPEDRDAFYMLEDSGILTTEREETTLYDGREWRIHYWMFRKDTIRALAEQNRRTQETERTNVYEDVPDYVWDGRKPSPRLSG